MHQIKILSSSHHSSRETRINCMEVAAKMSSTMKSPECITFKGNITCKDNTTQLSEDHPLGGVKYIFEFGSPTFKLFFHPATPCKFNKYSVTYIQLMFYSTIVTNRVYHRYFLFKFSYYSFIYLSPIQPNIIKYNATNLRSNTRVSFYCFIRKIPLYYF
jgi:hypothetical protein